MRHKEKIKMKEKEISQRFKKIAEEYKGYRNTALLISWVRCRIEEGLLKTGSEFDPIIGNYIALLDALYKLEQFESILKDEEPGTKALVDLINIARNSEQLDKFCNELKNKK